MPTILVKDGAKVKRRALVEWDPHFTPIMAEVPGIVRLVDITPGVTMKEEFNPVNEATDRIISEHKEERHPSLHIVDDKGKVGGAVRAERGHRADACPEDGRRVTAGTVMARIPRARTKSKDITGGLPRVDELFEARKPKDAAVIAEIDGAIHVRGIVKGARKFTIIADNGEERLYSIPIVATPHRARRRDRSEPATIITDGTPTPHDILASRARRPSWSSCWPEVQEVYRLQGVNINDKHIECIIRQMLKKVVVEEVGDTRFLLRAAGGQVRVRRGEREHALQGRHAGRGASEAARTHQGVARNRVVHLGSVASRRPRACSPTRPCAVVTITCGA